LQWQAEEDVYTDICPVAIIQGMTRAYNMWASVRDFGALPKNGGIMEQPARWMKIIRLCESEYNKKAEQDTGEFDSALRD
jgi:hypothetical protein